MFRLLELIQDFFALKEHDDCSLIFFSLIHIIFGDDKLRYSLCDLLEPFVLAIDDLDCHLIDDFEVIIGDLKLVLIFLVLVHNEDLFLETIDLIFLLLFFFGDVINRRSVGLRDEIVDHLHNFLLFITQSVKGAGDT